MSNERTGAGQSICAPVTGMYMHITAYYGIAPSVLEQLGARWRSTDLVAPPEDYSFIDIGAGMGRGLLIASRMAFREVIGVELHPELAAMAEKNIHAWEGGWACALPDEDCL